MEENIIEETSAMSLVEQKEQEIRNLEADLSSVASPTGDWKIAKCMEYQAAGKDAPYDIGELHVKRQAIRDKINMLQEEIMQEKQKEGSGA